MKTPRYCEFGCVDFRSPKCSLPTRTEKVFALFAELAPSIIEAGVSAEEVAASKISLEANIAACISQHRQNPEMLGL